MLDLEQIVEILRENKKPYLYLRIKRDAYSVPYNAGTFECANCTTEDTVEGRMNKAIEWLTGIVNKFPSNTMFSVVAKSSIKASGTGIIGPLAFTNVKAGEETPQQNNAIGLSPEMLRQQGYLTHGEVQAMLMEERIKHKDELHRRDMDDMKKEFAEKIEHTISTASKWSPEHLTTLSQNVASLLGLVTGKQPGIAGVPETEKSKEVEPIDMSLSDLSNYLKNNYSLSQIENFKQQLKNQNNERQQQEHTDK